jgi:hypothetical protein
MTEQKLKLKKSAQSINESIVDELWMSGRSLDWQTWDCADCSSFGLPLPTRAPTVLRNYEFIEVLLQACP